MPARVLVIGLDSAEASLIERWTSEGKLPALAELYASGSTYRLDNSWDTLPTGVWPELTTGRSPGDVGLFFPPNQLRTGESRPHRVEADEVDATGFWTIASDAGRRVAVVDVPWTVRPDDLNGLFLAEWGTHDRWFGTSCFPASLAEEVRIRHGDFPVGLCDHDYGASSSERTRLVTDLRASIRYETDLFLDVLGREEWDLFTCAFGQFQCVGHNFWEYMDADESVPAALRSAVLDVYSAIDGAVGELRAAAGRDSVCVVVASHGMGPAVGGPQLLSEVLVRLGAGSGSGSAAVVRSRLPVGVRTALRRVVPGPLRRRLQVAAGSLPAPLDSSATRAVALPCDVNGYVRLNIRGREPNGSVAPGAEARTELEALRSGLLELEQPATGENIVAQVVSADEAFGEQHHPDVPDLMVRFRTDLGPLEECVSERVGHVRVPYRVANRSGDHTGESRLWLVGDGAPSGSVDGRGHARDLAPTVLALLDVAVPQDLPGRSLVA